MKERLLAIVGLGLIGGSVAASLKARGSPWRVRAYDRRRGGLDVAQRRGIIDEAAASARDAVQGADLVLLATPVGAIRELLRSLRPHLVAGQLVTDVGSTKASIVAEAAALPDGVFFVGGHPMAGSERSGVGAAVEGLFEGRRCILTPTDQTPRSALEELTGFWTALGSEVRMLSPEVHDRLVARVSHLPNLVAYTVVSSVSSGVPREALELGGGTLRDVTRVAQSPPALWRDVCLENRDEVVAALEEFTSQLERLKRAVALGDVDDLEGFLRTANETRSTAWKP